MGFDKDIQAKVLTMCKRHCCLCEKYKKTKIELHHIKQQAKGGKDTFENCIPLCFDCHAEVGAYNPDHPKGKNYSAKELKKIRDNFYEKVKNGYVEQSISKDDKKLLKKIKKDMGSILEYILDIDFASEPFRIELSDEVDFIIGIYSKRSYDFDNDDLDSTKDAIIENLRYLNTYLSNPNYFHPVVDNEMLIFNNHPSENLEELRKNTLGIRNDIYQLYNKLCDFK